MFASIANFCIESSHHKVTKDVTVVTSGGLQAGVYGNLCFRLR